MVNGSEGRLPGFEYVIEYRLGMACRLCQGTDRALLFRKDDPSIGICEPCAMAAHWAWRQLAGEITSGFPEEDLKRVSTVYALIVRRKEIPKIDAAPGDDEQAVRAPAELNSSWEFLLAKDGNGIFSPPSISSDSHPDMRDQSKAALAALSGVSLSSWPALSEPLFTSYSPRGRLVGVVLIRGWFEQGEKPDRPILFWRPWPLSGHTVPMAGFWKSLETVWTLRLHKHCVIEDNGELCVRLREAACRYIDLQIALRAGKASDASMSAIYKSSMSADELAVERLIRLAEERFKNDRSLAVIPREMEARREPSVSVPMRRGSSIAPWDEPADGDGPDDPGDESGLGEDGDQEDGLDEPAQDADNDDDDSIPGPEDSSFVRPRRPLKR